MRLRFWLGCMAAGALLGVSACGGSAKPAASASAIAKPAGAHAYVKSAPGGMDIAIDLAGMRADKVMSKVILRAEAASDSKMNDFIKTLDRMDATSVGSGDTAEAVAVLWGRFPQDPTQVPLLGPDKSFEAAPPLASGVKTFTHDKGECLFVLSGAVWVMANGSMCATVKDKLAVDPEPPAIPSDQPLLFASMGPAFLSSIKGAESVDHGELEIKAGMSSLKGRLTFKEEGAAKDAETKVRGISALISILAGGGCKAVSNLSVDVVRDASKLSVELKGLAETADAWDPATCPKLGGEPPEPIAAATPVTPKPAKAVRPRKK